MSTVQLAENNAIGSYCKCVLSQITKLHYNFGEEVKKNTTFCVLCMFRMTLSSSVAADGMQRAIFLLSRHWQTYSFFARNIRHLHGGGEGQKGHATHEAMQDERRNSHTTGLVAPIHMRDTNFCTFIYNPGIYLG